MIDRDGECKDTCLLSCTSRTADGRTAAVAELRATKLTGTFVVRRFKGTFVVQSEATC